MSFLPYASFILGLIGGTHCASMCGGIVLVAAKSNKHNSSYQVGRFFGYFLLLCFIMTIGQIISLKDYSNELALLSGILMGGAFILLGISLLVKSKFNIKLPNFLDHRIFALWKKLLAKKNISLFDSFIIGSISVLLPCGLLYSVVIPLGLLDTFLFAVLCLFSFWVGTLPLVSIAPGLFRKILLPIKTKAPVFTSLFLIFFGLSTISVRVYKVMSIDMKENPELLICR